MVKVNPNEQDPQARGGGNFTETPLQKQQWRRVRKLIKDTRVGVEDTFAVKGLIGKVLLDNGNKYFVETTKDRKTGEPKPWFHIKVVPVITDERIVAEGEEPLVLPPKKVGISFFDGRNKDGTRSPIRGGMFDLHLACTGEEPDQGLVKGTSAWDTDDYNKQPVLIEMIFRGLEEEGSQYYGTRANLRVFVQTFKPDPDVHSTGLPWDDDDDDDEVVGESESGPKGEPAVVAAGKASNLDDDDEF